eukprot:CAMPEP_0116850918 /NCGR_PEP_ID=MMETSP0418-20121206/16426_1 /TAXON_ID=1158023 /ORGANISM="Astrosyne radiata, Strain 13vi08-1A" /LENGTH=264 /DNA_ID=CAMNT_0004482867 /DNA_START=1037 /DNA_END=1831 /DNA_ORIENTATION=+
MSRKSAKQIVIEAFSALSGDYDVEKVKELFSEDIIQHGNLPTGRAAVIASIPKFKEAGVTRNTHRILEDGDIVACHSTNSNGKAVFGGIDSIAIFNVWRVDKEGKVAEHWVNLQPILKGPNPSGRTMTDGTTEISDLDKTATNKEIMTNFLETIVIPGHWDKIGTVLSPEKYIQHNPNVGDGVETLQAYMKKVAEEGNGFIYEKLHRVVGEGAFVLTMAEGKQGAVQTAFFDLWRLEDGMVVEHWDVVQAIPPAEQQKHKNGKF